jgi:hypothetical protein
MRNQYDKLRSNFAYSSFARCDAIAASTPHPSRPHRSARYGPDLESCGCVDAPPGISKMSTQLSLKIFYPDAISYDEMDAYNDAFSLWYKIWLETRREVDDKLAAPSDSFSRQGEILMLYHDDRPIATCCHRYIDLRHRCAIHDSYLTSAIWPENIRVIILSLGQVCLLGSHIFLDMDFRRGRSELPISSIVCSLSLAHVRGTKPDVLLGVTRIDRGINKGFHDGGAISPTTDASWYQIPVDLIALLPKKIPITVDSRYHEVVQTIGRTCDRFNVNYFERTHLNGGSDVARASDILERAG